MNPFDRRRALQLGFGLLLAPTIATRSARAGGQPQEGALPIPQEPLKLTRTLRRELFDGAALTVTRIWQLEFRRSAGGALVTGRQVAAQVDAPASLNALARLEQDRSDNGRFPIRLDASGMIIATSQQGESQALEQALEIARQRIRAAGLLAKEQQDSTRMLATLTQSAGQMLGEMQADFFYPQNTSWQEQREVDLPGGLRGVVDVQFRAQLCEEGALLQESLREITTRLGGTSRKASESWSLLPA